LTIDTEVHPPKLLLIRGRAELDLVEGIPDEYLQMNGSYQMTPEQRVAWEAEVRSLYDGMVRIVVTPTWAKLIDFETTLPSAVEALVRQREERARAWNPPGNAPAECQESVPRSVPALNAATIGRTHQGEPDGQVPAAQALPGRPGTGQRRADGPVDAGGDRGPRAVHGGFRRAA